MKQRGSGGTYLYTGINTDLAGRAVCIASVHSNHAYAACGVLQMPATDGDRCGHDTVAGKHGGGACWRVGYGYGEVRFAAGLDSSFNGGKAKAKRQRFRGDKR
jgi:hypothetical protein